MFYFKLCFVARQLFCLIFFIFDIKKKINLYLIFHSYIMEKIKIYYPNCERLTKRYLDVLNFEDLIKLKKDLDQYLKKGSYEYHISLYTLLSYLLNIYFEKFNQEEIVNIKKDMNDNYTIASLVKHNIEVIQREYTQNTIIERKIFKERKKEPIKIADEMIHLKIDEKKYKLKEINLTNLATLFNQMKIQGNSFRIYDVIKMIKEMEYVRNFKILLKEKKISNTTHNDFLPIFLYCILIVLKKNINEIKRIMNGDLERTIYMNDGSNFKLISISDKTYFFLRFNLVTEGRKQIIYF